MNMKSSTIMRNRITENIGVLSISNGADNKIEDAVFLDLLEFERWIEANNFKGLIITGKGRHFSSGANIENIKKHKDSIPELEKNLNQGKRILNFIERIPIVTVAAISGACFGAGLEIALSCDYRIATVKSLFSFPESSLGLMPGLGGTIRLPALVGPGKANEVILSGQIFSCEEAFNMGIVDFKTEKKELLPSTIQFIEKLTDHCTEKQIELILQSVRQKKQCDWQLYEQESRFFVDLVKVME